MRAVVRALSIVGCLLLPLLACHGAAQATPTMEPPEPTPTSFVAHREEESMLHAGVFRLTVTMVTHLSNAVLLTVEVENTSNQAAEWSPDEAVAEAYVLDGSKRSSATDVQGIFAEEATFEEGATEIGWLVFPLPTGETFRFYYPECEPEYVTLGSP